MLMRLTVVDGPDKGRHFPLGEAGIKTIGNSRKNTDICIHDLVASRVHCEVEVDGDRIVVTDSDDSSGTYVNGEKIRQQALAAGDVMRIGNTFLRLETDDAASRDTALEGEEEAEVLEAVEEEDDPSLLAPEQLEVLSGKPMGRYELGAVLGHGFSGVVFEACDHQKGDQPVAVKVLHALFPKTEPEMKNFVDAMKARMPLRHAHLVSLSGAGRTGGYCWIAMELVEGESAAQKIESSRSKPKIDWKRGFRVAVHIARALEFLHEHDQVHANITPKNILFRTSDKVVKLNDLLLNVALDDSALQQATLETKLLAELPYFAPEQTGGDAPVDSLSDLYNLGAVVFSLLTGHLPFEARSTEQLIARICEMSAPRPRKYQPGVPEPMEKLVLRLMAKHPEDRYQSASELLADLDRISKHEAIEV